MQRLVGQEQVQGALRHTEMNRFRLIWACSPKLTHPKGTVRDFLSDFFGENEEVSEMEK